VLNSKKIVPSESSLIAKGLPTSLEGLYYMQLVMTERYETNHSVMYTKRGKGEDSILKMIQQLQD
jgi:hypothetical protein